MGAKATKLITVPTFTFNQGDQFTDTEFERPVSVDFYEGTITLRQDGDYEVQEEILISPAHFERFVKEVRKKLKEANAHRQNKK